MNSIKTFFQFAVIYLAIFISIDKDTANKFVEYVTVY
jgi:hypothetical protein